MKKLLTTLLILLCITPVTFAKDYDIVGETRLYAAAAMDDPARREKTREKWKEIVSNSGQLVSGPTYAEQLEAEKKKNAAKRQSATDRALARMIIVFPLMIVVGIGYWLIVKIKEKVTENKNNGENKVQRIYGVASTTPFPQQSTPAAPSFQQRSNISFNDLRELKKLLDEGVITQEEFDKAKKKILG